LEIGRATLDGWVMTVGELLGPVVSAMRADLLWASYLQTSTKTVLLMPGKSPHDWEANGKKFEFFGISLEGPGENCVQLSLLLESRAVRTGRETAGAASGAAVWNQCVESHCPKAG
jgi:hypothetical protein